MGGYAEQRTAIEAAALAAANTLGNIVVQDPTTGQYIGLSDSAPIGRTGAFGVAADGYGVPVVGINTLLATVRLDMAVADMFQDPIWQQRAAEDYKYAMSVEKTLNTQLTSMLSGGSGTDINGNTINALQDAINAYQSNCQRLTGASKNRYVPGSMVLTLGCIPNNGGSTAQSVTNTPVPQNGGLATVPDPLQVNGFYTAFVDVPYTPVSDAFFSGTAHFVFSGCGASVMLCDPLAFATTPPGIPSGTVWVPSVVKAEADQQFTDADEHGKKMTRTVHAAAAAQVACNFDRRPHPGALTLSFPNGVPDEVTSPLAIYQDPAHSMNESCVNEFETATNGGDYPENALLNNATLSPSYWAGFHPRITRPLSLAIYDWIRRSGCTLNVQQLVSGFFNSTITPAGPNGPAQIYVYEFTPAVSAQGVPTSQLLPSATPNIISAGVPTILSRRVSQNQWVAIAGGALYSTNGRCYDIDIKDSVYAVGTNKGGCHAGEPLGNQVPPMNGAGVNLANGPLSIDMVSPPTGEYPYPLNPPGSGMRPTNLGPNFVNGLQGVEGQAVDIRFRFSGFPWTVPCGPPPFSTTPMPL